MMQIEIARIYPSEGERKPGAVIDVRGQRYKCWLPTLDRLAPGHAYDVEIKEDEYDGRVSKKIVKVNSQVDLFTMSAKPARAPSADQGSASQGSAPAGNGAHPARDHDEMAFVNATLPAMIAAGMVDDVDKAIVYLKTVFKRRFGGAS